MEYTETQTAILVKKIETRISKLNKEIQRLENRYYDKLAKNKNRERRNYQFSRDRDGFEVITEKKEEVSKLQTFVEQLQELPITQLCFSAFFCKKCVGEILTSGQMKESWHVSPVCGKLFYGGSILKIMEVGKIKYM